MRQFILGIVVGVTLGAAGSVGAQRPNEPCNPPAWILWGRADSAWVPIESFEQKVACEKQAVLAEPLWATQMKHKYPDTVMTVQATCFPDTFDPRPKR